MIHDLNKSFDKLIEKIKKKVYGKTFFCPVCHLELSYHDTNEDGLLVCPLCGVVIELADVFGHPLPVVHDVEIKRSQPKKRIHPVATHLPIGLLPFALLGSCFLFAVSVFKRGYPLLNDGALPTGKIASFLTYMPVVNNVVMILLALAIFGSLLTFGSGLWDWITRYGKRPYRVISLKIILSVIFLVVGTITVLLHFMGLVFAKETGIAPLTLNTIVFPVVYFGLMFGNMFVIAVLGHVGGNLVFGK